MRGLLILAAIPMLALPLAGCIGGPGVAVVGVFSEWNLPDGDPTPVPLADCQALLELLDTRAWTEAETALESGWEGHRPITWFGFNGDAVPSTGMRLAAQQDAPEVQLTSATAEVTGTNNQETGVDEADVVKTDGEWTYVYQGGKLYILRSETVGDLQEHAVLELATAYATGSLLLERRDPDDPADDRLLVLTRSADPTAQPPSANDTRYDGRYWVSTPFYQNAYTHVRVFDLADRADPVLLEELWVEGEQVGARLVDGTAYIVVHAPPQVDLQTHLPLSSDHLRSMGHDWTSYHKLNETERRAITDSLVQEVSEENRKTLDNSTLEDHIPTVYHNTTEGPVARATTEQDCRRFLTSENTTGRAVSTIIALSVADDTIDEQQTQLIGNRPIVYGAQDALVLAESARDTWWFWRHQDRDEATDIHWFDLDGLDVTHRASGRVAGIVRDSFGIDVHDDTFRVITTTGQWNRWWLEEREPMMSHVAVFGEADGALVPRGMVGGIAPNETLWSARFTDDRAYLVTFEQTDPLWVVDLRDPDDPTILGELEVPGVSTYIHPLSDDLLLTIGYGPRDGDLGLDRSRLQVNLFDITDPTRPERADVLDVTPEGGRSWSSAAQEHKAFTYWDRLGMLAIPVSTFQFHDGLAESHVGLRLIEVDVEDKDLSVYGEVDQDALLPAPARHWRGEIQRSHFLGHVDEGIVSVYAMSGLGMTAHDLETLEPQDAVRFDVDPYL